MNDARFGEVAHNFFNHSEPPSGWKKSNTSSIASRVFSVDYGFLGDNWSFFPSFAGAIEFYRWRCAYLSPGKNHATGLTAGLKECCYNLVLNLRRELWKLTMYKCCVILCLRKSRHFSTPPLVSPRNALHTDEASLPRCGYCPSD